VTPAKHTKEVQVDWQTVVPLGDTLCVRTDTAVDAGWAKAFEVVLHEHQHRTPHREWGRIDFEYGSGDKQAAHLVLYVRAIKPGARSLDLRRTLDGIVKVSNTVAQVGPHVYELAHELREPPAPAGPRQSTPPPPPGELRANAA
jgi:hypothetical protein